MYPGFPIPIVGPGEKWDTSEPVDDDLIDGEKDLDVEETEVDEEENGQEDEFDGWEIKGVEEDPDFAEEPEVWDEEFNDA